MRKRTISNVFDNLMWYLVYLLPVIGFLIVLIHNQMTFTDYMAQWGIIVSNPLLTSVFELFGSDGIMPLFSETNSGMLYYSVWFLSVYIVHLAVDVVLFIPRFAHKFIEKSTQND